MKLLNTNLLGPFLSGLAIVTVIAIGCTPIPTATFTHTATTTPTPSPTLKLSQVVARYYDVQQLSDRALVHVQWLSQKLGARPSASPQEKKAAEYIAQQLHSYGYQVELQDFVVQVTEEVGENLKIEVPVERAITTSTMAGSGHGKVSAPLVFVKLGRAEDFTLKGLEGSIALIQRGGMTFRQKVENALQFGVSGVVIFNNESGLSQGTLRQAFQIPVVAISKTNGEALLSLLKQGEVSVPQTPGANDNGSGTAVLLAVAEELANQELPLEIRIISFGSEEIGLLGSIHYIGALSNEERDLTVGMLNFDALGSGGLRIGGDLFLVERTLDMARSSGIQTSTSLEPVGSSSDHAPFREAGIPVQFFFGTDFSRIHTPEDRIEFVDQKLLGQAVALGVIDTLGR